MSEGLVDDAPAPFAATQREEVHERQGSQVILLDHDGAGSVAGMDDGGNSRCVCAAYVGGVLRDILKERADGHVEAPVAEHTVARSWPGFR
jgi:hypothetical protein